MGTTGPVPPKAKERQRSISWVKAYPKELGEPSWKVLLFLTKATSRGWLHMALLLTLDGRWAGIYGVSPPPSGEAPTLSPQSQAGSLEVHTHSREGLPNPQALFQAQ